jgi:two-component system sensor histidine kinase KdpD
MHRARLIRPYLIALAVVAVCALLGWATHLLGLANANVVMIFLAGVVLVAASCGHGPATAAAILGIVLFDFFFVDPKYSFAPSDTQYVVDLGVMLGTGLLISELTSRLRTQLRTAQEQEHRTAQLYLLTRRLGELNGVEALVAGAGQHLREATRGDVSIYLCDLAGNKRVAFGPPVSIGEDRPLPAAIDWVLARSEAAGRGTGKYAESNWLLVPMIGSQRTLGVLAVHPRDDDRYVDADERQALETCANLIALSIERERSRAEAQQAQVQIEAEQLRNALLSSVSHDLRTPLATIAVTASSLLDGAPEQTEETRKEVIETVVDESRRLAHQVDNLLDMARLDGAPILLDRDGQVVEELVGVSLGQMRQELKGRTVSVNIPGDLPLVWAASELIERVLVNILENAVRYTPPGTPIEISAGRAGDWVEIRLTDYGPGLPLEHESQIFEKFYRATSVVADGQRGVGLGLAICRTIVRAHGGEITAANRPSGGAEFLITLPCVAASPEVTLDEVSTAADG